MRETLRRTARTFVQAAAGYAVANITVITAEGNWSDVEWVKTTLIGIGVSAVAAGFAAVMNLPPREHGRADIGTTSAEG